jgi:hypothetical protein
MIGLTTAEASPIASTALSPVDGTSSGGLYTVEIVEGESLAEVRLTANAGAIKQDRPGC